MEKGRIASRESLLMDRLEKAEQANLPCASRSLPPGAGAQEAARTGATRRLRRQREACPTLPEVILVRILLGPSVKRTPTWFQCSSQSECLSKLKRSWPEASPAGSPMAQLCIKPADGCRQWSRFQLLKKTGSGPQSLPTLATSPPSGVRWFW